MKTSILALIVLGFTATAHAATTWDLAGDWSDVANPNGAWSYNMAPGVPLTQNWSDWDAIDITYTSDQPAWAVEPVPGPQHVPGWLKSLGVALPGYDLPAGHVAVHGAETERTGSDFAGVTWTSPLTGWIAIAGDTWLGRKTLGRSMNWQLSHNGTVLTGGGLTSGDSFTSLSPFDLATGFGGADALTLPVTAGDVLNFEVYRPSAALPAEYVGIDLSIAAAAGLYWHDESLGAIKQSGHDGTNPHTVVNTGIAGTGLALDSVNGKLYWTNTGDDKVQRSNLDGSNVEDLITTGLHVPLGMAVDPINGKIYWTDQGPDKISRANLDGSGREVLVSAGTQHPYGIDLDVENGKMYWTDSLTNLVQRANLDGSGLEDLTSLGNVPAFPSPRGLKLDTVHDKVYVASQGEGAIKWMNLDGTNVETIVSAPNWNGPEDIALDLANGKMYWTGQGSILKIQRANLDGSNIEDVITDGLGIPRAIEFLGPVVPEPSAEAIAALGLLALLGLARRARVAAASTISGPVRVRSTK